MLFALFVVTAWFYSSMAEDSTHTVANKHQDQIQILERADEALSGTNEASNDRDQG